MKRIILILLVLANGVIAQQAEEVTVPAFRDTCETIFGVEICDPFREFEEIENPKRADWIAKKRQQADQLLTNVAGYDAIGQEIEQFSSGSPVRGYVPVVNNGYTYALQVNSELDVEQIVRYESPLDSGSVLLTTKDIEIASGSRYLISSFNPSPDNRYLAVEVYNERDEMEIRIFDTLTARMTDEVIDASISYYPYWLPDSQRFFYTQLSLPGDSVDLFDNVTVKLHSIGTDQEEDQLVLSGNTSVSLPYGAGDFPTIQVLPDSATVRCSLSRGIAQYTEYFLMPLVELINPGIQASNWQRLNAAEDNVTKAVFDATSAYLLSAQNDSTTVTRISLDDLTDREVIATQTSGFINDMEARRSAVYLEVVTDGISSILRIDQSGRTELPLPFPGDVNLKASGFPSKASGEGLVFGLANWNRGYGVYYYDPATDTVVRTNIRPLGAYDLPSDLVVEEVSVTSHDSVQVPLSIIYQKGVNRDGNAPVILEVYGAYGTSLEPYLEVEMLAWYRRGGIVAKAHVRGGGEKGAHWHTQGRQDKKENSWKDLIACAEYLVDGGYTRPAKLGVAAASAGGIAAGRAITERPELFGAAVLEYAFLNPVRLASTIDGKIHYEEFGDPTDSVEFQYLVHMDPYVHISPGKNYPAVLLTAGANDTRVEVWEPAKFAAKLESRRSNDKVTLLKVYDNGHGASGTAEVNHQIRDRLTFFLWQLNPDSSQQ